MRRAAEEDISRHRAIIREEQRGIAASSRIVNSVRPVAKLLPEILSEIFIHVAVDPFSYTTTKYSEFAPVVNNGRATVGPYSWIVITHVCHRWREAALRSPRLWSFVYLGPKEQVQEFLKRSGQAPLRIRPWMIPNSRGVVPMWGQEGLRHLKASLLAYSLRLVLAEVHRIETMSLTLAGPVLERVFGEFKDGFHAPRLESLTFTSLGEQAFPNILTKCHLPRLTHVNIQGYVIPWQSPFLRVGSITSLVLHQTQFMTMSLVQDTIRNLLDVLSHLPRLEKLDISHGYVSHSDSLQGMPTAHLPCLKRLKMSSAAVNIDAFLSHCTFPPTAITRFEIPIKQNSTHTWTGVTPQGEENSYLLRSVISKSVDVIQGYMPITGLKIYIQTVAMEYPIDMNPTIKCRITISTYHFNPASISRYVDSSMPDPRFAVEFSYTGPFEVPDLLRDLLLSLPLSQTVFLHASCAPDSSINNSSSDMGRFFTSLITRCSPTGLEALQITGLGVELLPSILSSWSSTTPYDGDVLANGSETCPNPYGDNLLARGLFGSIRTLVLSELRKSMKRRKISYSDFINLCDAIRSQAKYYKHQCGPFTKLVLQRCSIERDWLFDLVDAFAELFHQQGRFTENLPSEPYDLHWFVPGSWSPPPSPSPTPTDDLPDKDLDWNGWAHQDGQTPVFRTEGDWADHARYGRITFDFRGQPYIELERIFKMNSSLRNSL